MLETNTGTTYSRNLALRKARGKYIGIMDSDVEIFEGTIGQLIHTLDEDENAGLVAPRLVYPNGSPPKIN
ncbi:MAG: glycosyltransferase [Desulfobacterales bacterium]|nr:glycosyltransferase [Desulfobacterales bacterium]